MSVRFVVRIPSPPLSFFVASLWSYQGPPRAHRLERIMPDGAAALIVNLRDDRIPGYDPERLMPKRFLPRS